MAHGLCMLHGCLVVVMFTQCQKGSLETVTMAEKNVWRFVAACKGSVAKCMGFVVACMAFVAARMGFVVACMAFVAACMAFVVAYMGFVDACMGFVAACMGFVAACMGLLAAWMIVGCMAPLYEDENLFACQCHTGCTACIVRMVILW
jgi:hypothetical protein